MFKKKIEKEKKDVDESEMAGGEWGYDEQT